MVEADLGRARRQHVGVADVEAVDEVGLQQAFLQRHLVAACLGEPQQPVGQQGVGAQGAVEAELESRSRPRRP